MKTANEIQSKLRECSTSLFNYQSSVAMLKGLNCSIAEEMIAADREKSVEDLRELYVMLHNVFNPKPENMVQMAELHALSLNTAL